MPSINMLLVGVAGAAITFAAGLYLGYEYESGQVAKATVKAGVHTLHTVEKQATITTAAATQAQATHDRIVYVTRTITKEIPGAITHETDLRFALPVGLVRLHDAAALGVDLSAIPYPAGQSDDAPSAVAASGLGSVIVSNYGECRDDQARLTELQDWITAQQAAFAAKGN